ncbi:type II toxin-antitoxin system HicA family toxin [Microgenomates group bacterium]|nr:type II toxin-antitoxin system HicA family toxin [Microgenomates group bacterium]
MIEKHGFDKNRQSGSHAIFLHQNGRWTSIPIHRKTIGKGLLRKILRDTQLTVNDLKRK